MVGRDCGDWTERMGRSNDSDDGRKVVAALWQVVNELNRCSMVVILW